ncbi:MAG: lspA [Dehalococcoidia bacterium]|nr:lspA [Dehalococcoidia bacterium]
MMSLFILIATLAADQVSKGMVRLALIPGQSVPESGVFRLTYVTNTGSALGFFPNQTLFLIAASLVGIGALLLFYRTHHASGVLLHISLGLQLGGALGNLVDRVRLGHVTDFIYVGWWPVFNLADSAIMVGLATLLWIIVSAKERAAPGAEMAGEQSPPGSGAESASGARDTVSDGDRSP